MGGKKKNLALSKARAESVKAFLEAEGVGPERLEAVGLGQEKPVADNATKAGREQNERIELHIKGAQAEAPEEDEGAADAPEPPPDKPRLRPLHRPTTKKQSKNSELHHHLQFPLDG